MKTSTNRSRRSTHSRHAAETGKGIMLLVILLLITIYSFSQTPAYLDFRNPVLETVVPAPMGFNKRLSQSPKWKNKLQTARGMDNFPPRNRYDG
jgi:hypothetical protein